MNYKRSIMKVEGKQSEKRKGRREKGFKIKEDDRDVEVSKVRYTRERKCHHESHYPL